MDYLSVIYDRQLRPKTAYVTRYAEFIVSMLKSKFGLSPNGRTLVEMGCGNCDILNEFHALGFSVKGVDSVASAGFEYPHIPVVLADIDGKRLPFLDNSVDVIFSKSVIEHLYHPEAFLRECYRCLKTDGVLITMTPDWEVQYKKFFDDWTHKRPFTLYTMTNIYSLFNFRLEYIAYFKQLPILWHSPLLIFLSNLIAPLVPLRTRSKVRWLRERQILAFGQK